MHLMAGDLCQPVDDVIQRIKHSRFKLFRIGWIGWIGWIGRIGRIMVVRLGTGGERGSVLDRRKGHADG